MFSGWRLPVWFWLVTTLPSLSTILKLILVSFLLSAIFFIGSWASVGKLKKFWSFRSSEISKLKFSLLWAQHIYFVANYKLCIKWEIEVTYVWLKWEMEAYWCWNITVFILFLVGNLQLRQLKGQGNAEYYIWQILLMHVQIWVIKLMNFQMIRPHLHWLLEEGAVLKRK